MKASYRVALALAAALAVALAAALLYRASTPGPAAGTPPASAPSAATGVVEYPAANKAPASAAATTIEPPAGTRPIATADIGDSLDQLLGRQAVLKFLQIDDFPRRVVATVDNLGRESAPPRLWPVNPPAGRFTTLEGGGAARISPDNALRYEPLVSLAEAVSVEAAVDLYARLYPLFQKAYEELGYPGRSFNDRLLEVIDLLLATPEPAAPVKLELLEIKGSVRSERPWVHYQFADPGFEALAAGQKVLIRTGAVNMQRLKAKLREYRQRIAARSRPR